MDKSKDNRGISPETDEILERVDRGFGDRKKSEKQKILSNLLITGGLLLIIVPLIITAMNMKRNADAMTSFLDEAEIALVQAIENVEDVDTFYETDVVFDPVNAEAAPENPGEGASTDLTEPDSEETSSPAEETSSPAEENPAPAKAPLMTQEEMQRRMTGVLFIDKIDVRIPIMDGVDDETLRVAAGRIPESGILDKIGNAVLAGHRSYTFGKYFNRLDEIVIGDTFAIKTGKKTLEYEVFRIRIVEPDDFSVLNYNKTDKIVTLFTCHPIIIANKRLVVQGVQTN